MGHFFCFVLFCLHISPLTWRTENPIAGNLRADRSGTRNDENRQERECLKVKDYDELRNIRSNFSLISKVINYWNDVETRLLYTCVSFFFHIFNDSGKNKKEIKGKSFPPVYTKHLSLHGNKVDARSTLILLWIFHCSLARLASAFFSYLLRQQIDGFMFHFSPFFRCL